MGFMSILRIFAVARFQGQTEACNLALAQT